jgi:hypothetical protein
VCNSSGRSLCFWLRLTGFFVNGFFFSLVLFRPFFSLRGSTLVQRDHFDRTHSAPNRGGEGERERRGRGKSPPCRRRARPPRSETSLSASVEPRSLRPSATCEWGLRGVGDLGAASPSSSSSR